MRSPRTVKESDQHKNNMDFYFDLSRVQALTRVNKTSAPTVSDDRSQGYDIGTSWYDETNDNLYCCLDNTIGAAVWIKPVKASGDTMTGSLNFDNGAYVIFDKAAGNGVKIDTDSPGYAWADLLGAINTRPTAGAGAGAVPDYVSYGGTSIYAFRFGTIAPNNHLHEAFIEFHVPHDYVVGTDLYLHAHWSQATVDTGGTAGVPGVVKWYFDVLYAKGHGTAGGAARGAFTPPAVTTSITQQGSTTQYGHMIAEVQLSASSPSASQIDTDNIEVDGLILCRIYRDPTDPADTLNQDTFLHFVDIHYQSTGIGTKQKAPDFYS